MTEVKETAIGEAIENYAIVAKGEIKNWRDYGSEVAAKLDSPGDYKADCAAADLATGVSLAIKTAANLTLGAVDAVLLVASRLDEPYSPSSDEFSTHLNGATLKLKGDLTTFDNTLPASAVTIDPEQLDHSETTFRLVVEDATGYEPGFYEGTVEASKPEEQPEDVEVNILLA